MPRADFYLIAKPRFLERPLLLVCELAKRAHASGQPALVLARDMAQAEELDDLLWSFDPDEYLPHQIAGTDEDEDDTPIVISAPEVDTPSRPLVINLRDDVWLKPCDRILEVVPADPAAREPLRERWKQYKALGFDLNKHDM
ncbi:MAG: DNA polymerase III subunit chi [Pseudoxanthomonas sp.]